ncbi:hypothetical protein [Lysinibacillus sp. K60]|uniref:hypothetical protein n=1 Tax=Lysinibacillus sp. K60 TaxID=2720027 RepID=UPI001C8B2CBE|nr:hypothetical protein [Lysinibacillus sp. K60]MBX8945997.1 hypothetical protein [Lysinibacillus sp. K60]
MEEPKRLPPTKDVLRELYLKSGNQCAFPGCYQTILNDKGVLVGVICHIEAAMPGGERFNKNQTNEDRRAAANLILLCHEHHKETDDVVKFPVNRLQEMKKAHEKKYSDVADKLYNSIVDRTSLQGFQYCQSLNNMNSVIGWKHNEEELFPMIQQINDKVDILRKLSPDTRSIFKIMLERTVNSQVHIALIEESTGIDRYKLREHIVILNNYGLVSYPYKDEWTHTYCTDISSEDGHWNIWLEIKEFSQKTSISLEEIIQNMNFSLLD